MVASIHKHLPRKKILYYDFGLEPEQVKEARGWCNVHVVSMAKVSQGGEMTPYSTARVLSIIHALKAHTAVLWLDTGLSLNSGQLIGIYRQAADNQGLVFIRPVTGHTSFSVTKGHSGHGEAAGLLIMRTEYACESALWWWYLCTRLEDCVVPTFSTMCAHSEAQPSPPTAIHDHSYQNCKSLSLSVLNILGGNMYQFYVKKYGLKYRMVTRTILSGVRETSQKYILSLCT